LRGQLKHTYLTNTICLKTQPEKLRVSVNYEENGIPRHRVIRNQIAELQEVMGDPDRGFSPAQLMDQLSPFRELTVQERQVMKEKVHRQFAHDFRLGERKRRLEEKSTLFLKALEYFVAPALVADPAAKHGMHEVQEGARALIAELESLPKGIWLWKTAGKETLIS
jgi:hypothetical protein